MSETVVPLCQITSVVDYPEKRRTAPNSLKELRRAQKRSQEPRHVQEGSDGSSGQLRLALESLDHIRRARESSELPRAAQESLGELRTAQRS